MAWHIDRLPARCSTRPVFLAACFFAWHSTLEFFLRLGGWKEAPRFMANTQFASTPDRERSSARRARRRGWLALALPLAALLALVLVPAVAFAGGPTSGPTPGIALSPSSGPVGTHVSASGTDFHA